MKEDSARTLLNKIMGWSEPQQINKEHPDLQALAAFGYDGYHQFSPAMRFIESLANWLFRFPQDKRGAAYKFVRDRLLYISRPQMEHLVSIAYSDFIIPRLLKQVSEDSELSTSEWEISKLSNSDEFKILLNQSLFLGLSDGSYIDDFRRSHHEINHEQVFRTHEISKIRAAKLLEKLQERLQNFTSKKHVNYFRNVFLLDDFSASGISYLNEDTSKPNNVKGKIANFLDSIKDQNDPIYKLVNCDDLHVHVILYVATENAINYLQTYGKKVFSPISFKVIAIHTLPDSICFDEESEKEFLELVKQYGSDNLEDEHFSQGKTDKLYLGFNEGGLPLILHHNTPNNSLPILWRNDNKSDFKGLFPRFSRHQ